jgi:DnaJ family protein C protein 17
MPSNETKTNATFDTDFYALLDISFEASQKELDRAWRKTARKYHPDKVGNDPVAKERFYLVQIGYDLLSDPASKALYDNARNARLQRKRQSELFEGRRRQMKDDLEAREQGVKRPREEDDEEKLEREIRRLAEDGKRRRKEREDTLRKEMQREAEMDSGAKTSGSDTPHQNGAPNAQSGVSELDRTVKVRWPVEGEGGSITADHVKQMFSKFGKIESADVLNPKMSRLGKKQKKQLAVVCMIQYKSVVGAHAAVEDFPKQEGSEWEFYDSVFWAANKEPDFLNPRQSEGATTISTPSTPTARSTQQRIDSATSIKFSTPIASPLSNGDGLKKKPSFASFSPAAASTPKSSPFGKGLGVNSPSLEEMTMIRLKNAEKRRLAAEIEKRDAEDDAAAAAAVKRGVL